MNTKQKYQFKRLIKELDSIRGRHTELITVYIPSGYDLNKVIAHLAQEQGTASNIKDKTTRDHVIDSLEKMIRHLRLFKRTPQNGLVAFSGNASEKENKVDIKIWSIEPPEPMNTRMYRCDQTFVTDILKNMFESKEVYGLIVLDRRDGTVGLLKGTSMGSLAHLTSGVPGKFRAGGQCCSESTLIMLDNGNIVEIKDVHNPNIVVSENFNQEIIEPTPIMLKWTNKKELFRIITCYPRLEIDTSQDHTFFLRTDKGIEEKPLVEIKEGDYLVMPEEIKLNLEDQKIKFKPEIRRKFNMKKIKFPRKIKPKLSRILGYYLGDGSYEIDRLTFSEQRKDVANYYKRLIEDTFGIKVDLRFRRDKNYYQIRVYSRILSQLFKSFITNSKKTLSEKIPEDILKSSDESLASFIAGFFDAGGYVSDSRIGLGINNSILARQLQFCLLRLGIIASLIKYTNRKNPYSNNIRYSLEINDNTSIKRFNKEVGFCSKEKQDRVKDIIKNRSNKNKVRQLIINGKEIARILRNSGLDTMQFRAPSFFVNKRQMSKEVFKAKILDKIKNNELRKRLELFYNSNLIAVKIAKIEKIGLANTIDIETKNHNFIANGLIVHNSAHRFERLIEGMAKEFYKRIAEIANKEFLPMKNLKGILIGGPGHTKEDFLDCNYLNNELKKKIISIQDLSYTGDFGLQELLDKSKDALSEAEVAKEKAIMQKFFEMLAKEQNKVTYGIKEVEKVLEMKVVDTLLISETLDDELIEKLEEKGTKEGAKVEIISVESREGLQLKELGGVAAILRFPIAL